MKLRLATVALFFSATAVCAQAAAPLGSVDMTVPLKNLDGSPMVDPATRKLDDPTCANCKPITRGAIIAAALAHTYCPAGPQAPGRDQIIPPGCTEDERDPLNGARVLWGRAKLAQDLIDNRAAVLSPAQIALIEKLVPARFPDGLIISQIIPVIDPSATPAEIK